MPREHIKNSFRRPEAYLPIGDYAVIGNLHTVALVGKNGSIDWCCIPRFDAPSVFGALLDSEKGGFFRIAPLDTPGMERKQLYLPDTNILITRFLTADGVGEIIDFMPIKEVGGAAHQHHLVRSVQVVRGSLSFEMVCRPALIMHAMRMRSTYRMMGRSLPAKSLCLALSSTCHSVPFEKDGKGGVRAPLPYNKGKRRIFSLKVRVDQDVRRASSYAPLL